jgi:hypothetical protein
LEPLLTFCAVPEIFTSDSCLASSYLTLVHCCQFTRSPIRKYPEAFSNFPVRHVNPKTYMGRSPEYADPSDGSLMDSPSTGVSGSCFLYCFRDPHLLSQQLRAFPVEVPRYTTLSLDSALNPVPSSTFTPEVFPLTVIGLCFQNLPLLSFYTASTGWLLPDPLLADLLSGKPHCKLPWPVTPSAVVGSHGFNPKVSLTLLPECTFLSFRYLWINTGYSWTSRFWSWLLDRFWFYNQSLPITTFRTYYLSPLGSK